MKIRRSIAAALVAVAGLVGGVGVAHATVPTGGGSGVDTSFHNKPLYDAGNPTMAKDHICQARMAGPYPSSGYVVAKYRVECRDRSYLMHTSYVDTLKTYSSTPIVGKSIRNTYANCTSANAVRRVDGNGVVWWGCSHTLTVKDPAGRQNWVSTSYVEDQVAGGAPRSGQGGTTAVTTYQSVNAWCKSHQSYCASHSGVRAAQFWVG